MRSAGRQGSGGGRKTAGILTVQCKCRSCKQDEITSKKYTGGSRRIGGCQRIKCATNAVYIRNIPANHDSVFVGYSCSDTNAEPCAGGPGTLGTGRALALRGKAGCLTRSMGNK